MLHLISDVLQAAGLVQSASLQSASHSKEVGPTRISTLERSQSSRVSRPSASHTGGRSILEDGEMEQVGVFSRARHTSLLSFESIRSSDRAAPLLEPATAFESGE